MPLRGTTIKTTPLFSNLAVDQPLLISFGSGILMGLAPAPLNAWWLAWIALAPLWLLTQRSARSPWPVALCWSLGYHGLALSWIRDLHPLTWMGVPWLASLAVTGFCWAAITLWGSALVVIWARLMGWSQALPAGLRILLGASLWSGLEAIWNQSILDWTMLAYTQSPANLAILHLGQLSGPFPISAAIVACNGLLAEAWMARPQRRALRYLACAAGLLLLLHGIGFWLSSQPLRDLPAQALKIGLVQGNVPTRVKLFDQSLSSRSYLEGYRALVAEGAEAVLTPEGALPWLWINRPAQNPLYVAIQQQGTPAWLGTVGWQQGKTTQTLFSLDGQGEVVGQYDKVKLVPLGEYIPFEPLLGQLIGRLSPVGLSMRPGSFNQQLQTPFGLAIAGICYDSAFPELFRRQAATGGQFILTASNNDPYGRGLMAQHQAHDVMRAIETSRWAVRATNTGYSGVIDPHGRIQWRSGFRTAETHLHTIYQRSAQTLYLRWGNWLTLLLLGLSLLGLALLGWLRWRTSHSF
jgi:apolipoprotein N-acyltransferase